jgi:hypothetical protein
MKKLHRGLSLIAAILLSSSCSHFTRTDPSKADQAEFEDLKTVYSKLKEGQSRSEIEAFLEGRRELICEGNAPGPQRCQVKFRIAAGEDLGASSLGIQIANANVRDEFRVLTLDFRAGKLLRWESKSETIRR